VVRPRPGSLDGFQLRYADEVHQHPELFKQLRDLAQKGRVTLVYSAHDEEHNDAIVLHSLLLGRAARVGAANKD
jgi:uncharacterized protein YeaO (DUF488 family)